MYSQMPIYLGTSQEFLEDRNAYVKHCQHDWQERTPPL